MSISRIFRFRRPIVAGLIVPLLFLCVDASAFARHSQDNKSLAKVLSAEAKTDYVTIKYEFTSEAAGSYTVSMDLLKKGEPGFRLPLRSLSGDIGVVQSSGGIREVQWKFASDYPAGIQGGDYYFRITLEKVAGDDNLWYYIGGGLAVAVGVVAYVVFGNKASESSELPAAPVRPSL